MTERSLTAALADLPIGFPEVPDLEATLAGIEAASMRRRIPTLRWAVAAIVIAAFAVVALVAPVREAIADWLGIGVIRIVEVEEIPTGLEDTLGDLGNEVGLDASHPVPAALGPPDQVFARADAGPAEISMIWLPRDDLPEVGSTGVGAILTRFGGILDGPVIEKSVAADTVVVNVTIDGSPGWWIGGAAHSFGYLDAEGDVVFKTLRLAGNTLLWEDEGLSYRFESGLGMDEAIQVAESLP